MPIRLGISLLAITVLSLLVAGNIFLGNKDYASQTFYSGPSIKIGNIAILVEIARGDTEAQKGLSGRSSLDRDMGMLFIFKEEGNYTFWMKDMNFPIDIIWINGGMVVGVTPNISNEVKPGEALPLYNPPVPVRYALEVNAGFAKKHGIMIGDEVIFKE